MDHYQLTAVQAADALRSGEIGIEAYIKSCLERTKEFEEQIRAWAFWDPEFILAQAREADRIRQSGRGIGSLHGLPIGVQDLFDTKGMPSAAGTPIHGGRSPVTDATTVSLLRQAGAIIAGKTATAEVGAGAPGPTCNPHDGKRSPGGSGGAAAVASYMVPLAVGSQADADIITSASFCGVVGYVPSQGLVSRYRMLKMSPRFDRVGVFARDIGDAALLVQALMAYDDRDPVMQPRGRADLTAVAASEPPGPLRLACVRTAAWSEAAEDPTREAFDELVEHLGDHGTVIELSDAFREVTEWFKTIYLAELAHAMGPTYDEAGDKLSDGLREKIEAGRAVSAVDYQRAVERIDGTGRVIGDVLADYDAILTPAALGEATQDLETTGDPAFGMPWSFCGLPALSLPLLQGPAGLPVGVQMIAGPFDDARLLRNGRWLVNSVEE